MREKITISRLIEKMDEATDEFIILGYENSLIRLFISPMLFLGSFVLFMFRFIYMHENLAIVLTDALILFSMGIFSETYLKMAKNEEMKSHVSSAFLAVLLSFMVVRLYYLVGTALIMFSIAIIILSIVRMKKEMLIITIVTFFFLNMHIWTHSYQYHNGPLFYITSTVSFAFLIYVSINVHRVVYNGTRKKKQQLKQIQLSEKKLMRTLLSVGDGVISTDSESNVEFINPVAEKMTGWNLEEAYGKPSDSVFCIINEFTRENQISPIQTVHETGKVVELANHTLLISRDGTERSIEDTAAPISDDEGNIIGCVLVFKDSSEKKEKQRRVEYLSYHDQLTGIYNRRFFEEEMLRLDTIRNLPISVIYADVNGLKTINDAFGHQTGDQLIQQVAVAIKAECRADDILARTGGDEFVLLLPATDDNSAEGMAIRIRERIEQEKIFDINISVSCGWATKDLGNQDISEILKNAEDAMYQAKILSSSSKRSAVIRAINNALLVKSPREEAHSMRVSLLCESIGRAYQLSDESVKELRVAGELHDIGKIAVDETILNKVERLTEAEWIQIKAHPETGYRLLSTSSEYFGMAKFILEHHERWDGKGYPKGLKGEGINWKARIIAIADSYDAMICERPYRKALTQEEAVSEIRKCAGTQFDPDVAKVFVEKVIGVTW